ncbi:MAG: YdeI/OmpD-associated family protein [Acidimicrobiia bacterium]|nr:YdeI/OmpD-associated family protein [Acidimicrobiia bacterium]MDH4307942.1 YdeI/OmpD-associated family protein [Acidimicrobiia bacterium]
MSRVPTTSSEHPESWRFGYPIYHAESRAQWRAWLEVNHDAERGVWLCSWRTATGKPRCPYPEVVEEALCFGWIDSTNVVLDPERSIQLITPRRSKSPWSRLNRSRVETMEAAGLMTDAGWRAVEVAKANGWWTISDSVEDLIEPDDLARALDANKAARAAWDGFTPSVRKQMLWWLVAAATATTRAKRIAAIVDKAAIGEPAR